MTKKAYLAPDIQTIALNTNVSLMMLSPYDTVELEVTDPTETVSAEKALAPMFGTGSFDDIE